MEPALCGAFKRAARDCGLSSLFHFLDNSLERKAFGSRQRQTLLEQVVDFFYEKVIKCHLYS